MTHENAPAHAQHSLLIKATPDIVWARITNVTAWPDHFRHVSFASMKGDFAVGNHFTWKSGGVKIVSTIRELKPHQFIRWTGKAMGTQADHIWTLTPQGEQTLLQTSESFDGWLVRLMPGQMQAMLDKTLREWLEDIAKTV